MVLVAFLSTETLSADSGDHSDSHSDEVVNSRRTRRRLNTSGEGPSGGGAHSDISSSSSSLHSGSSSGLTPISDTDSAQSMNNKRIAPGSTKFHNHAYEFYDAKEKYHQVMGDAYNRSSKNDPSAKKTLESINFKCNKKS